MKRIIIDSLIPFIVTVFTLAVPSRGAAEDVASVSLEQLLRPVEVVTEKKSNGDSMASGDNQTEAPKVVFLTENEIVSHLADGIRKTLEEGDKLEISCKASVSPLRLRSDDVWNIYTDDPFSPDTRGSWFPLVKVEVNGQIAHSWRLPLKVALFRSCHMATFRLDRGDSPKFPSVKPVVCNIYEHRGSPIPATIDLSGYELVQSVAEGRYVSWNDVTRRPDVRRGDMVDVLLESGGLSISIVALSLENGILGQTVALKNPRSRQEFSGVVSGNKRAHVVN